MRISEYILTPADVWRLGANMRLGRRDMIGILIGVLVFLFFKFPLNQNGEDSLFVAVLFGSLWWRLDPRYPLIGAIGVLVLIPILQLLQNVLWLGDSSEPLAVIAYYLLVIGVLGQVRELRAGGGEETEEEIVEKKKPPKPRKPIKRVKMRDMETIAKLRANREALRRRDW